MFENHNAPKIPTEEELLAARAHKNRAAVILVVLIVLIAIAAAAAKEMAMPLAKGNLGVITDARTNRTLTQSEVQTIAAEQAAQQKTYVFTGKISAVSEKTAKITNAEGMIEVALQDGVSIVKKLPQADAKGEDETKIGLKELAIGDYATVFIPNGATSVEMQSGAISVSMFSVNLPPAAEE